MSFRLSVPDLLFLLLFAAAVVPAALLRKTAGLVLAYAAAIGCAVYAVFVDSHTDEVTATLLVVLGGPFLLGAAVPVKPWRWAAIVGLAIPLKTLAASLAKGPAFDLRILITLLVALAGAYIGAILRGAGHRPAPSAPPLQK